MAKQVFTGYQINTRGELVYIIHGGKHCTIAATGAVC